MLLDTCSDSAADARPEESDIAAIGGPRSVFPILRSLLVKLEQCEARLKSGSAWDATAYYDFALLFSRPSEFALNASF